MMSDEPTASHTCEFVIRGTTEQCAFVCGYGKSKVIHDKDPLCLCSDGAGMCRRCGVFVHATEFATWDFADGCEIEICSICHTIYRHSSLAGMSRDQVRALKRISENGCTMVDPVSGKSYLVHDRPFSTSEYDTDYNRTLEYTHCIRCGVSCQYNETRSYQTGRAEAQQKKAFDDELRMLVSEGKTALAIMRYREKHPFADRKDAIEYVKALR